MPAAAQSHEIIIGEVCDKLLQIGLRSKEVLANVGTARDDVFLELSVNGCIHLPNKVASGVLGEQVVPLATPDHLDHIPAGSTEEAFELLDDLAVAAHRSVEALQVAVDDPGEIVETFARRDGECAGRLGLVHLAVTEEGPDAAPRCACEAAVL